MTMKKSQHSLGGPPKTRPKSRRSAANRRSISGLSVEPLTVSRFPALERLFGANGACGGCWCMTPRLPLREYEAGKGESNRRALRALAKRDLAPGVLVFRGDEPIAWCAIAPRAEYLRLSTSRVLAPVDGAEVWSIVCLFVKKDERRSGISRVAIRAAVDYAASRGARIVEAYPIDPVKGDVAPVFAWTGLLSAYLDVGFREVARRSPTRPIVRKVVRAR